MVVSHDIGLTGGDNFMVPLCIIVLTAIAVALFNRN